MLYLNNVNSKQDSLRKNSPDFIIMHKIAGFYFSSHAKHSHLAFPSCFTFEFPHTIMTPCIPLARVK